MYQKARDSMIDVNVFSTPINKTAALVTGQPDRPGGKFVKLSNELENLQLAISANADILGATISKKERRPLGERQRDLQEKIRSVKRELKLFNIIRRETMKDLIVKECTKHFSEEEWATITQSADLEFRRRELETN